MKTIDASEFLSLVWPHTLLRNESLELRAIRRKDETISRRFVKSIGEFLSTAKAYGDGWDIYYGVCTRADRGGKKENCSRICTVWVDFDHVETLPDFKKVPPDIIVNSGGGFHVYWLLEEPVYVRTGRWKEIESVVMGLTKRFKGDEMACDITRILRVPGFMNHKYDPPRKVTANALQAE